MTTRKPRKPKTPAPAAIGEDTPSPQVASPPPDRHTVRTIVRGAYDIQRLRIQMGNRICAQFKAKLGQEPSTPEEDMDPESQAILKDLRAEYKKLMDGVKKAKLATFKASPLISNYTEFTLLQQYMDLEESERNHFKNLGEVLKEFPIFTQFLTTVKGIGPAMAGVIVSEIDITVATYPSSLYQYSGLGCEKDGRGTSKRKEHLHEITYKDKDGNPATRMGIRYNPFLKTKLMGVLASSFIKQKDSPYREHYDYIKHRYQNHPDWATKTKGHIHAASMRWMIKQFLKDLYNVWRKLEGLPVNVSYTEGKLGIKHKEGWVPGSLDKWMDAGEGERA